MNWLEKASINKPCLQYMFTRKKKEDVTDFKIDSAPETSLSFVRPKCVP